SKGLGNAICERFGKEGMAVVVNYNSDPEGAEDVVRTIESNGGRAVAVQADVGTWGGVKTLLDAAVSNFGSLHVWVNNAGIEKASSTHEMSLEDWEKVINVNLTGVFLGSKCALGYFLEYGRKGNIINMSSVHERIQWPTFAHYAASKGGVAMFTKTIALEYAARGIRVNAIGPGAINTPINAAKFSDPAKLRETTEMVPMKSIGEPEDIAAAAAWLASAESKYVTGITLFVDGGMTLYPAFQAGKG
ncbi:MAG: SDR family oxidoreductase, partial [Deltaproteobacteria bacterium]|nr:SDR family oxidoreductase [Deltaproteobacteria bacterium]